MFNVYYNTLKPDTELFFYYDTTTLDVYSYFKKGRFIPRIIYT